MTAFTLKRSETTQLPATRCTFQPYVSESGKKWVRLSVQYFYPSLGWVGTMGRGDGDYAVKHARELYATFLQRGFTAA
jgi:hypothetical protein